MFVRWKKRKSVDKQPGHQLWKAGELTYSAELVESYRLNGKPRQKVIAFLGSIKQSELASVTSRYYFWHHLMTEKMKEYPLRTLPPKQQHAIFEALQKQVPLTAEDFAAEYERTKHVVRLWNMPTF
jgi:hypothetical protein